MTATIDDYIAGFPPDVRPILERVRRTIRAAVPNAEEAISYRIPTFRLNGKYLVYFAGHKNHVGLYPVEADDAALAKELAPYASGKATLKFPLTEPIPTRLIAKIVKLKAKRSRTR